MKGRVVSNAGPIIALSSIERVNILRELFEEVIVPEDVHFEVIHGGKSYAGLESYLNAKWIRVVSPSTPIDPLLGTLVGKGEASVIHLAREGRADLALIDEKKARKIARKIYGIRVIGSVRVLVEAKHRGFVSSVRVALEEMRLAGYWVHDDIVRAALKQAKEE
ncbi:MAG: DUF3368 domain-containing protein [Desulfacinum sp.]|jgi:hypothetical protein|nr:DUF3368 domain-containing protein [Desulfacinum sp.]MBZ4660522.1 hypothetical protein [Desulfacinum sp.]